MIQFTQREMKSSWRQAAQCWSDQNGGVINNVHRLMLFYAVECGLKAIYLKRESKQVMLNEAASNFLHDLNKLLTYLKADKSLLLPNSIKLPEIKTPVITRVIQCGAINQVWRYGAKMHEPSDSEVETKLSQINEWIKGELK